MIVPPDKTVGLRIDVSLAEFTTIRLGGNAKYFVIARSTDDIRSALRFAASERLPVQILGGGSNVIFPDEGFHGLVIKVDLKGVRFEDEDEHTIAVAAAGEVWDDFAKLCIDKNLSGVECLSGIPGLVGATPIQNVGAYGQEVGETIIEVSVIDRQSLDVIRFSSDDCGFGYRNSRFKRNDKDKFVIVEVCYRLKKSGEPFIRYDELRNYLGPMGERNGEWKAEKGKTGLRQVREAVLALRRRKSMVIDPADPNSRSVGSFFVNPVLSEEEYNKFVERLMPLAIERPPSFKSVEGIKIPAAWLVENSGFHKGYVRNGVGISSNHALALVNHSGTTRELLSLASDIEKAVFERFGVKLEKEAVVV